MSISCEEKGVALRGIDVNYKEKLKVECKTNLQSEGVKRIVFYTAIPYVQKTQMVGKDVEVSGRINFFICYENEDGQLKKCECSSDFLCQFKDVKVGGNFYVNPTVFVEKTESDLSGVYLTTTAYVCVDLLVTPINEFKYVCGGEGLFLDKQEREVYVGVGQKNIPYATEEDFILPYCIEEVLEQKADVIITSSQCGVNSIIVDGEVNLSIILLQSGEKRDIIREERTIPFRAEIDIDDTMPTFFGVANASVKSFKMEISVDEEQLKSQITAKILLNLEGEAYKQEQLYLVEDAFSVEEEVQLEREDCVMQVPKTCAVYQERISGKSNIEELPIGANYCCFVNENVELTSTSATENGINIIGVCCLTALFVDGEGKLMGRRLETPFNCLVNHNVQENQTYSVQVFVKNMQVKIESLTSGELICELVFKVCNKENVRVNLVKEIKSIGEKKPNDLAISVYIPKKDEKLFELSKRLNVNPNQLVLTNKELQFPLTGEERIVVYRQK